MWKIVRRWHHQLAHLHIHKDWSRNVFRKYAKFQNVITSLFFNQFSSGFHCFVQGNFTLSSEIKLNLFWTSPLKPYLKSIVWMCSVQQTVWIKWMYVLLYEHNSAYVPLVTFPNYLKDLKFDISGLLNGSKMKMSHMFKMSTFDEWNHCDSVPIFFI